MKDTIYLSVFGLNLALINELKAIINIALQEKYEISWTHIADSKLQLLLINEDFINIPHIEQMDKKHFQILRIKKSDTNTTQQIINNTIYLPLFDEKPLIQWIQSYFFNLLKSNNLSYQLNNNSLSIQNQKFNYDNLENIFKDIFKKYRTGLFLLQSESDDIAILDFDRFQFYLKPNLQIITTKNLNIIPASINQILSIKKHAKGIDLKQGVWQFIWDYLDQEIPNYPLHYQIKRWPKISNRTDRIHLFKLSTVFSSGSHISYAESSLKIGHKYINFFLCVSDLAGDLIPISENISPFKLTQQNKTKNNGLSGFFNSLRKKLGL